MAVGTSITSNGGGITLVSGKGSTQGGNSEIASGTASAGDGIGGRLALKSGGGDVVVSGTNATASHMSVTSDGSIRVKAAATSSLEIRGGNNMNISVDTGELTVSHGETTVPGGVIWRLQPNKMISHVPAQITEVTYPSDRRIKTDIEDIDEDDILQRLQTLEVKKYRYSEMWREIRGIPDVTVRGVIAQQVEETFPEYVTISTLTLPEKNFSLEQFHEVNKQQITMDLIAAIHAQHRRFKVGPNSEAQSGRIDIATADAGSYTNASPTGSSGDISVETGSSSVSTSGDVSIATGDSIAGEGGDLVLEAGTAQGSGTAAGSVVIASGGNYENPGNVNLQTPDSRGSRNSGSISVTTGWSAFGESGSIAISTGDSLTGAKGVVDVTSMSTRVRP
ncbi:uncharacterized protein PITG_01491 [Phytophthora infestans T30-4]|uniref:Peptidase S74 domain-containing protein n=1 Tax=Phytophthora infestans (strain T30-4) TaxID=403677 RepID=D0MTD8_PHYIT|nr:uncharacterized protein PITG_01491 [Phytophthora infestans T30-4]EEY61235.1 conserved hypothetical protein [Phytophthora infestans T30-4]|eukprot:XP_002908152.1 conserved hypothetical protein [Phytophthora infestans T30-4]